MHLFHHPFLSTLTQPSKTLLALMLVSCVIACGRGEADKNSQSIVRVNDDEITVHQVNYQLQRTNINPKNQEAASKQIVSSLVDRQILVQEAMKAELDRNPQVMQAIEDNKMQILAKAYIESKVASVAKPTDSEVIDYRNKNPDIFENRKLYAMEELSFAINPSQLPELEVLSNTAKTIDEVVLWLDSKQIKYGRSKLVHTAESFPTNLLTKIKDLKSDELIFVNSPSKITVGKLLETKLQPISLADSKPIIERILLNQKQKALAESEMLRLRKASNINYLDKKFDIATQAKSGEIKSSESKPATAETPVETPSEKPNASSEEAKKINEHVEKGLSGL